MEGKRTGRLNLVDLAGSERPRLTGPVTPMHQDPCGDLICLPRRHACEVPRARDWRKRKRLIRAYQRWAPWPKLIQAARIRQQSASWHSYSSILARQCHISTYGKTREYVPATCSVPGLEAHAIAGGFFGRKLPHHHDGNMADKAVSSMLLNTTSSGLSLDDVCSDSDQKMRLSDRLPHSSQTLVFGLIMNAY